MGDEHLRSDHYVDVGREGDSAEMLARRTHRHLVEICSECGAEWEKLGPRLQATFQEQLHGITAGEPSAPRDDDDLPVDSAALAAQDSYVEQLRYLRRRAYEQLWILRRLPADERAAKVRGAYRQYRSRGFAELLIEEARSLVHGAPREALEWIELVPVALCWAHGADAPLWAKPLLARAAAHRANALRVLGDHPAAEQRFVDLRRDLARDPIADTAALAEITSLEASLRIEQNLHDEAEELLDRAALGYRHAGDAGGLARTRLKQVMLMRTLGRPEEILTLLGDTPPSAGIDDLYLALAVITERINALCELERFPEAHRILHRHTDEFEASEDPHAGAVFRCLEGRIALGLGEHAAAEEAFASCRDAMLTLDRYHDAAVACLYLAEVLLATGRTTDLRLLAGQLVERFRSSRLPAEAFQAIQLFSQAAAAERLTADLLARLRRHLSAPGATPTSHIT